MAGKFTAKDLPDNVLWDDNPDIIWDDKPQHSFTPQDIISDQQLDQDVQWDDEADVIWDDEPDNTMPHWKYSGIPEADAPVTDTVSQPEPLNLQSGLQGTSTIDPRQMTEQDKQTWGENKKSSWPEFINNALTELSQAELPRQGVDTQAGYGENVKRGMANTLAGMAELPVILPRMAVGAYKDIVWDPLTQQGVNKEGGNAVVKGIGNTLKGFTDMILSAIPGVNPQWAETIFRNPETLPFAVNLAYDIARGTVRKTSDVIDRFEGWKAEKGRLNQNWNRELVPVNMGEAINNLRDMGFSDSVIARMNPVYYQEILKQRSTPEMFGSSLKGTVKDMYDARKAQGMTDEQALSQIANTQAGKIQVNNIQEQIINTLHAEPVSIPKVEPQKEAPAEPIQKGITQPMVAGEAQAPKLREQEPGRNAIYNEIARNVPEMGKVTPQEVQNIPNEVEKGKAKELWEMTRGEVSDNIPRENPNNIVDNTYDVLEALSNRSNRKPYNPEAITLGSFQELKNRGFVSGGFKSIKLTEDGRNYLREVGEKKLASDNAFYDKNDIEIDRILDKHKLSVQQALSEGKPVPPEVLADYPDLAPSVETGVQGEIPSHVERAIQNPRDVSVSVATKTKQQTKQTLNENFDTGVIRPTQPIRLTTVDELRSIARTGMLTEGKDFEGRKGISAQITEGKKPIVAYGDNDKISAAIIFPEDSIEGKGQAPNEVKISPKVTMDKLRFVVDGHKGLLTWEDLKGIIAEKVEAKENVEQGAESGGLYFEPEKDFKRRMPEGEGEPGKPVKRSDIVKFLNEKLDIPIRTGRFRQKALGIFKIKEEVVRLKMANDIETIAHEVGHGLHKYLWGRTATGLSARPFKDFKDELEPIASKPRSGQSPLPEGFAEFIRLYITNEKEARNVAPRFYEHFEKLLDDKSPEAKEIFLEARKQFDRWVKQPALARVLGQISINENVKGKVNFEEIYTATIDELHPLKKAVMEMTKGEEIPITQDPYKLARLHAGWWGKPDTFLTYKPFDFNTYEFKGKSLQEILKPIEENLDEFRAYIISKRSLELNKRGIDTGILKQDAIKVVQDYGLKFAKRFEDLKEFQDAPLRYLAKSGVLDAETYAKIKTLNEDYVPLYRVMETEKGKGTGQGLQSYQPIKKIKGSWRDIVDPLESIIKNTYLYINLAEKNAIGQALIKLASEREGLGKYVERIPESMQRIKIFEPELLGILSKFGKWTETTQYKETQKTVGEKITEVGKEGESKTPAEKVEKVARQALVDRGFSEAEAEQILNRIKRAASPEQRSKIIEKTIEKISVIQVTKEFGLELPNDVAEIFRPSAFQPKENVITVYQGGRPVLYQVHPDIARTFQALDRESVSTLLKILSLPSKWLRAGATLSPEFIARNPFRDQFSAFVYSKYNYVPGYDLVRGIWHLVRKDETYWKWKQSGGEHSMFVSLDRGNLQKTLSEVLKTGRLKRIVKSPIEALRVLSEVMEAGTRIGEFAKGINKEGPTKAGAQKSAFAAREVTLDFARIGAKTKAVNGLIAFWNANIQGLDKMARAFKENPYITTLKAVAGITLPSVILTIANNDDDRWKEIPQWQKDIFWIVLTDNHIWRIPKPFELGIIFGTVPERITQAILNKDPRAFEGLLKTIGNGAAPGFLPTILTPLIEGWANQSFFLDRPIVPKGKEDLLPQYQYQPYTTEIAKSIGKAIAKIPGTGKTWLASPAKLENLLRGWTGNLGALALQTVDAGLKEAGISPDTVKPTRTLSDIPLIRGFSVRYPSASAESIRKFYDNYKRIDQILKTSKYLDRQGETDESDELLSHTDIINLTETYEALRIQHQVIDGIYVNPDINPEEKRRLIDEVYLEMIETASFGNELYDGLQP